MGNVTAGQLIIGGAIAYFMSRDVKASADKKDSPTSSVESVHEDIKIEPEITSETSHPVDIVPPTDSIETNTSDSEEKVSE